MIQVLCLHRHALAAVYHRTRRSHFNLPPFQTVCLFGNIIVCSVDCEITGFLPESQICLVVLYKEFDGCGAELFTAQAWVPSTELV